MNIKKISTYLTDAVQNPGRANLRPLAEEKATSGNSADRVQLSRDYQDLAARKALMAQDDIRTEKVDQVRNDLASGNYVIQPAEIAEKMMGEVM